MVKKPGLKLNAEPYIKKNQRCQLQYVQLINDAS